MTSSVDESPATVGRMVGYRTRHLVAYIVAMYCVVFSLFVLTWPDRWTVMVVDDLGFFAASVPGAVLAAWAARSARGRTRLAWLAVAAAMAAWAHADTIWASYELTGRPSPFPTMADAFYLVFHIAACVGLGLFAASPGPSRAGLVTDAVIMSLSLFLAFWLILFRPLVDHFGSDRLGLAVALSYPIADPVILTIAAVMLVRAGSGGLRPAMWVLTAGMVCIALGDVLFTLAFADDAYATGDVADVGWMAGLLLIGLAALWGRGADPNVYRADAIPGWASILLPYGSALLVAVVVAFQPPEVIKTPAVLITGAALGVAVLIRQYVAVTENRRLLSKVAAQAWHDPLTGLANRRLFAERTEQALRSRHRRGVPVAILIADVDDFKVINDNLGHPVGDELLTAFADRLLACVGPEPTVARLGGDEFAVLTEAGPEHAKALAESIVAAFGEPFGVAGIAVPMRPTIGFDVAAGDDDLTTETLLLRADAAMYEGKRIGGGGVHAFTGAPDGAGGAQNTGVRQGRPRSAETAQRALATQAVQTMRLLTDFRRALNDGHLEMFYQPQWDLSTGRISGAEALMRWPHPERGLLGPEEFLPLVRRHGLMRPVNEAALTMALADAARWQAPGGATRVAVNVFAPTLADRNLPANIAAALDRNDLQPSALTVEITEDLLLNDVGRARRVLDQIRETGIRLSIDDFGSGHSALTYLRDLPVDEVKLDRDFVAPVLTDPRAAAVVRAVVELAHHLGLVIVAEGVENAATAALLADYGCDVLQGNHFSPALPAAELMALFASPPDPTP